MNFQGANGLVTVTSKSVTTADLIALPLPFQVICYTQVTPVHDGNLDCTLESSGELLSTTASVTPAKALRKSGFKNSPTDSNVQPRLKPAELSNHPQPISEQMDPKMWIEATLPNIGYP